MKRVHVLVEGQTEEAFVGLVVQPHLWDHGVDLTPTIVCYTSGCRWPQLQRRSGQLDSRRT